MLVLQQWIHQNIIGATLNPVQLDTNIWLFSKIGSVVSHRAISHNFALYHLEMIFAVIKHKIHVDFMVYLMSFGIWWVYPELALIDLLIMAHKWYNCFDDSLISVPFFLNALPVPEYDIYDIIIYNFWTWFTLATQWGWVTVGICKHNWPQQALKIVFCM